MYSDKEKLWSGVTSDTENEQFMSIISYRVVARSYRVFITLSAQKWDRNDDLKTQWFSVPFKVFKPTYDLVFSYT